MLLQALRKMITLDVSSFSILDVAPCTEYERYIRTFGKQGHQQTGVQCGTDRSVLWCHMFGLLGAQLVAHDVIVRKRTCRLT